MLLKTLTANPLRSEHFYIHALFLQQYQHKGSYNITTSTTCTTEEGSKSLVSEPRTGWFLKTLIFHRARNRHHWQNLHLNNVTRLLIAKKFPTMSFSTHNLFTPLGDLIKSPYSELIHLSLPSTPCQLFWYSVKADRTINHTSNWINIRC